MEPSASVRAVRRAARRALRRLECAFGLRVLSVSPSLSSLSKREDELSSSLSFAGAGSVGLGALAGFKAALWINSSACWAAARLRVSRALADFEWDDATVVLDFGCGTMFWGGASSGVFSRERLWDFFSDLVFFLLSCDCERLAGGGVFGSITGMLSRED